MKELWDEIDIHLSLPVCTCGAAKAFNKHLEDDKTHKFLMDLDSTKYENARSNLLALDPLPKLNKSVRCYYKGRTTTEYYQRSWS